MFKAIIKFYKKNNKSPGRRDIKGADALIKKFGSWNNVLKEAGLPTRRAVNYTEDDLINSLRKFNKKHGKSPSYNDCNKYAYLYDPDTYFKKFKLNSWHEVLEKAGLEKLMVISKYNAYSDSELLHVLEKFFIEHNNTNKSYYNEFKKDLPSSTTLVKRFGSWVKLLDLLNLNNHETHTNDELISIFYEAKKHFGRVPSSTELEQFSKINTRIFTSRFESYNKFLKSIGEKINSISPSDVKESNEILIEMYKKFSLKNGYPNGAPAIILNQSNTIYNADVFSVRFGSLNKLRILCKMNINKTSDSLYNEQYLKSKVIELYKSLNKIPSNKELKEFGLSPTTLMRYFKTTSLQQYIKSFILSRK